MAGIPGVSSAAGAPGHTTYSNLSQADCYAVAVQAGLSAAHARVASAIAMAESGGNPNAHNTTPPDNSYGLWQINLYGSLASRVHEFGLKDASDLYSPAVNAAAMARISGKGSSFSAWSTYKDGSYKKYVNTDLSQSVVPGVVSAPFQAAKSTAEAAVDAAKVLGKSAEWISNPHNWIRVAFVVGGGVVLVAGVLAVLDSTKTGQAAVATAGKAKAAATNVGTAIATDGASTAAKGASKGAAKPPAKSAAPAPKSEAVKRAERGAASLAAAHKRGEESSKGKSES